MLYSIFLFLLLFVVPCLVFALYIYRLIFEVFLWLQLRDLRKDNNRLEKDLEDKDKVTMAIYWNARWWGWGGVGVGAWGRYRVGTLITSSSSYREKNSNN